MKKKLFLPVVAVALVLCCAIGGTLAWLTDKTAPVVNTFTVGDVNITLAETTGTEYKMVPGYILEKDPKVTVAAGSEDCWLFVEVEKAGNFDDFMTYSMANGWNQLKNADNEGVAGVFYREVKTTDTNRVFPVLENNQVAVKDIVTKEQMDALNATSKPTLTFTAYAVQKHRGNTGGSTQDFTPAEAWAAISDPNT